MLHLFTYQYLDQFRFLLAVLSDDAKVALVLPRSPTDIIFFQNGFHIFKPLKPGCIRYSRKTTPFTTIQRKTEFFGNRDGFNKMLPDRINVIKILISFYFPLQAVWQVDHVSFHHNDTR